jgi:hypothetical protein
MDVPPAKVLRTLPTRIENGKAPAHRQPMTAALEIRLRRYASFQEKLRQLRGKCAAKRAPAHDPPKWVVGQKVVPH